MDGTDMEESSDMKETGKPLASAMCSHVTDTPAAVLLCRMVIRQTTMKGPLR